MTQSKNFTPKIIGKPDYRAQENIRNIYERIADAATDLEASLGMYFDEDLNANEIIEFVNSDSPEKWLRDKWIKVNEVQPPKGFSLKKLIDNDMLDNPDPSDVLHARESVKQLLKELKREQKPLKLPKKPLFEYPIEKLYVNHQGSSFFIIETEEFENALKEATEYYTQSQEQNEVLEQMENIAQSLNKLHEKRVLHRINIDSLRNFVDQYLSCKGGEVSVNPQAFLKRGLKEM